MGNPSHEQFNQAHLHVVDLVKHDPCHLTHQFRPPTYVFWYVCMCVRVCVHMYFGMFVQVCACVCMCAHMCVYVCAHVCMCVCECAHVCVCVRTCQYVCECAQCMCVCVYACMCACVCMCGHVTFDTMVPDIQAIGSVMDCCTNASTHPSFNLYGPDWTTEHI